jgi:hypothetical protein
MEGCLHKLFHPYPMLLASLPPETMSGDGNFRHPRDPGAKLFASRIRVIVIRLEADRLQLELRLM